VHYAPEKSAIIWKIKQFGGGKEFLMRAELGLPSVKGDDERGGGMTGGFGGSMGGAGGVGKAKRPINVKFEIPYFTTSGIQVRYLKITEPKVRLFQQGISLDSFYLSDSWLITSHSCNTPLFPGCDTSHSRATLPCACRKSNENVPALCMIDFVQPPSVSSIPFLFSLSFCSSLFPHPSPLRPAGPIDNQIPPLFLLFSLLPLAAFCIGCEEYRWFGWDLMSSIVFEVNAMNVQCLVVGSL
jgi:hypothetical protein